MKRRLVGVTAAVLGTVLIGGVGLQATASAAPVPTVVTLPLFGAPLKLTITSGPGNAIASVAVDPATNTVATKLDAHKVVFQSSDPTDPTATAKVVVRSKHGGQSVSARAGSLADISGPGSWSGDVFGDGSAAATVSFTIAAAADGSPDITGTTASAGGVVGTVDHSTGDDDNESSMSARVSVKFTNTAGDLTRSLTISVKVKTDEDGNTSAKSSISLGRIKGVEGKAVGAHTWVGALCDGTAASIAYTVAADGTITVSAVTPASATTATDGDKTTVTFATGEQVRIRVKDHDGQMTIEVKERIRCDSPNATTNVSTSIPADNNNNDNNGGDNGGDNGGGHHGGHNDDNTSTTVVTSSSVVTPPAP
jgi:hypothetical protein